MTQRLFFLVLFLAASARAAVTVPLTIQESLFPGSTPGIQRTQDPVSFGVPLPDGTGIMSASQLGLSGAEAGQFRVLGKWPSGQAKWVLVDTLANVSAGGTNTGISLVGGGGNFGGPELASQNGNIITVNTGPASFSVRKSNFNLLDQVVVNGKILIIAGHSQGLVLFGPDATTSYPGNVTCLPTAGGTPCTTEYRSSNDVNSTVVIEENGPVKAVLKADGDHKDAAGHIYMHFTVRMFFYKGKTSVKLVTSLRNADLGTSNTFATAFKGHQGYEARLGLSLSGEAVYTIGNETPSSTPGSLASSDTVYLYQGISNYLNPKDCPSHHDTNGYCVLATNDTGFRIVKNGTVLRTGSMDQVPQGWADISDNSGGGVEIGAYQMAAFGSKSLEFGAGGSDVRIGIWARQNSKPYYQSWPQHSVNEIWVNFHAAAPSAPADEFLKFQYALVGRADRNAYNQAGVFFYPVLNPAEEDAFYGSAAITAKAPLPVSKTQYIKDNAVTPSDGNKIHRLLPWTYRDWEGGGGGNQMDYALGGCYNFIKRGFTGAWVNARHIYRHAASIGFPQADGFTWRSQAAGVDSLGQPTATSVNSQLATRNWPATWEHVHIYGMEVYYFMTGDETVREGLEGPTDLYLKPSLPVPGSVRGIAGVFMNIAHLMNFYRSLGDTTMVNALVQRGKDVYTNSVAPDLCVSGYPVGCSVAQASRGVSRMRGIPMAGGGEIPTGPTTSEKLCAASSERAAGTLHMSQLIEGLWEFRASVGSSWEAYNEALDLMYGVSQFTLSELYHDDGSGAWGPDSAALCNVPSSAPVPPTAVRTQSNTNGICGNGFRHYVFADIPNSCSVFYYPIQAEQTSWFPFFIQQVYTGGTDWLSKFMMGLQRTANSGAADEFGHYTIGATIDRALRPGNTVLVDVPLTVTANGGGAYTLSWTVPPHTQGYRMKTGVKKIVNWVGFDSWSNQWTGDPATTMPWFAAAEIANPPAPSGSGSIQTVTVTGSGHFALKAWVSSVTSLTLSSPAPTGNLHAGTSQATLSLATNISATCRYATTDMPFGSMALTFSSTGSTDHSTVVSVADGQNYTYYVRCQDLAGNASTLPFPITFSIASDTPPPPPPPPPSGMQWKQTWGQNPESSAQLPRTGDMPPQVWTEPAAYASQSQLVVVPSRGPFIWEEYHHDISVFSNAAYFYSWQDGGSSNYPWGQPVFYCNSTLDTANQGTDWPIVGTHWTLAVPIDSAQTAIVSSALPGATADSGIGAPITNANAFYPNTGGPVYIRIDDEIMELRDYNATTRTLSVKRGAMGSTAAAHTNTDPVTGPTGGRFSYTCQHPYVGNGINPPTALTQHYPVLAPVTRHPFGGFVYDSTHDVIWFAGGIDETYRPDDTYAYCYQNATGWCAGKAPVNFVTGTYRNAADAALVWDPDHAVLLAVGGQYAGDMVQLFCVEANPAVGCVNANQWNTIAEINAGEPAGTKYVSNPTSGPNQTALRGVYDTVRHAFVIWGGGVTCRGADCTGNVYNEVLYLLKWNSATQRWDWIMPNQVASDGSPCRFGLTCPNPDVRPAMSWDSKRGRVLDVAPTNAVTGNSDTYAGVWDGNIPGKFTWTNLNIVPGPSFNMIYCGVPSGNPQGCLDFPYVAYWEAHDALVIVGPGASKPTSMAAWELSLNPGPVKPGPAISLSRTALSFSLILGAANPPAQTVALFNNGTSGTTLNWQADDNANWFSTIPTEGSLAAGASKSLSISINAVGLAVGTYSGQITVNDPAASNGPQKIQVQLTVAPVGASLLLAEPSSLAFTMTSGTTDPSAQSVKITNGGMGTLSWTAQAVAAWAQVKPASGSPGQSFVVSAKGAGLAPGNYSTMVNVTASGAANSPLSIPITFVLKASNGSDPIPPVDWTMPILDWPPAIPLNGTLRVDYGTLPVEEVEWDFLAQKPTGLDSRAPARSPAAIVIRTPSATLTLLQQGLGLGDYLVTVKLWSGGMVRSQASKQVSIVAGNLAGIRVYPNPWRADKHATRSITFAGLTISTTIKLFTASGHEVKELKTDGPSLAWDLKNESGDKVASGVYLYLITDAAGDKVRGKIAVIR